MSGLADLVGTELGPSGWIEVDQARIDRFAEATDDPQWIHVDAERAAAGTFGSTIAHGFLTLSLCVPMLADVLPRDDRAAMVVNYGVDRVRFPAPLRSGGRVRGTFRVASAQDGPKGARVSIAATVEDGDGAIVCAADLVLLVVPSGV